MSAEQLSACHALCRSASNRREMGSFCLITVILTFSSCFVLTPARTDVQEYCASSQGITLVYRNSRLPVLYRNNLSEGRRAMHAVYAFPEMFLTCKRFLIALLNGSFVPISLYPPTSCLRKLRTGLMQAVYFAVYVCHPTSLALHLWAQTH